MEQLPLQLHSYEPPAPPEVLQSRGKELWQEMTSVFDFTGEPGKYAILERACRTADTIEQLETAMEGQQFTVKGSMGQAVINPLIAEARAQTNQLDKLIKSLNLPETSEEQLAQKAKLSAAGRTAARARHNTSR